MADSLDCNLDYKVPITKEDANLENPKSKKPSRKRRYIIFVGNNNITSIGIPKIYKHVYRKSLI